MKIQHVTIHAMDMERSIDFYRKVAQIDIVEDLRQFGSPIVFLADSAGDSRVEIIADPDNHFVGEGISIGFAVSDAEAEKERLEKLGFKTGPMITPSPRTKFFFVNDPDGVKVQFIQ